MDIVKKLTNRYLKSINPISYARRLGVLVGERCCFIGSPNWGSEPWLISIGNHTKISFDCAFTTHDGATWVFREREPYLNTVKFGRIQIGDNCFIGARSLILPGVVIGNDAIVAAGSVVTKSIPEGEVWGGVPARKITTTHEYAEKCRKSTPDYDTINYKTNFRQEVERICDIQRTMQPLQTGVTPLKDDIARQGPLGG